VIKRWRGDKDFSVKVYERRKMTQQQEAIQAMLEKVHLGLYEEFELVHFIMHYLIHPSQTAWLNAQDLTIQDTLNGRFNGEQEETILAFFQDWNLLCGEKLFSLGGR
jgi:hypothetical protein